MATSPAPSSSHTESNGQATEIRFKEALDRDRAHHVTNWIANWEHQERRRKTNTSYRDELPQDFYSFRGTSDLGSWLNWCAQEQYGDYFDDKTIEPLVQLSKERDAEIVSSYDLQFDMANYEKTLGRYNAQDYLFQNLYPVPERYAVHSLLDFGAGYGRQANLWNQLCPDLRYIAMDAIPLSYCLQNFYYQQMGVPFADYIDDPAGFAVGPQAGIYHVPTWRADLLADASVDMILCVQVLPEIGKRLLHFAVALFDRILKPGGCIFIRDHDLAWQPAHKEDVSGLLTARGFELEFRAHAIDRVDVHGIPRIWRKPDPAVLAARTPRKPKGVRQTISAIDERMGGFARRFYQRLKSQPSDSVV